MRAGTLFTLVLLALVAVGAWFVLDIRVNDAGRLPDVNVSVEDTGKLPDIDVGVRDVEVTTEKRTVEVPTVKVEGE
ncbi:hypothetical protein [Chthonobacter albigriseus]|uniref:hypothetical protein n=1 Tax=Chthonobacter albigriseus TaxID=1683161 RepID=UPI0015EEEB2D|nr:hypothetical protein [Chthonobacter albigriseus]